MRPFWRRLSRCGEVWRWFSAPQAGHLGRGVWRRAEGGHRRQVALLGVAGHLEAGAIEGAGQLLSDQVAHLVDIGHGDG